MSRITFTKLWPGQQCSILETIEIDHFFQDAQINTSKGIAWLSFAGANVEGRAFAISMVGYGTQHASVSATGEERHTYRVIAEPGCIVTDCLIRVHGAANGQINGVLEDSDMHVLAAGSFRVLGNQFPFRLRVDARPSPGEEMGEATIDVRVSPDSADVDGSVKYTWKKVVGNSDNWSGPDYEEEETQDCGGGLVELSAKTTLSLQAFNDDWNADACFIHAKMTCGIRTMHVAVTCSCEDRSGTMGVRHDDTHATPQSALDRQSSLLRQRRSELGSVLQESEEVSELPIRSVAEKGALEALQRAVSAGFGGTEIDGTRHLEGAIDTEGISRHQDVALSTLKKERQRAIVSHEVALVDMALAKIDLGYRLETSSLERLLGARQSTDPGGRES